VNKTLALDVPSQVTPTNGSTITAASEAGAIQAPPSAVPEFSWTGVGDALQYRVQLSQDIGFNTFNEFTTPHTRYTPINIGYLADGLWYWRVRVEAPVVGNYSPISSFTKQWASPHNLPILTMPLPDATLQFYDSPAFSWQPVIGAATYRLQISTAPEFAVLLYNQITIATTNQPTTKLPNGTYYWRVIPIDPVGRTGTAGERRFLLPPGIFNRPIFQRLHHTHRHAQYHVHAARHSSQRYQHLLARARPLGRIDFQLEPHLDFPQAVVYPATASDTSEHLPAGALPIL
jgi:hypothetical protein